MSNIFPIFEFILWDNCTNNCKFCFQKKKSISFLQYDKKIESINSTIDFIKSDKFISGSHVLLVGGEIFDDSTIKDYMMQLFDFISDMMSQQKINLLYFNTNLLYNIDNVLVPILTIFKEKKLFNRVKFTTSDDVYGRFINTEKKILYLSNLIKVKTSFPDVNIVVNTILTKQFCDFELNTNESIIRQYKNDYNVYVNLLPYVTIDENFTPEKHNVIRTLQHEERLNPGYLKQYIENMDLRQDKLIYRFIDGEFKFSSASKTKCGHVVNFKKYSEFNTCYVCDIKRIFQK